MRVFALRGKSWFSQLKNRDFLLNVNTFIEALDRLQDVHAVVVFKFSIPRSLSSECPWVGKKVGFKWSVLK